ncbi:MAG TPA: NnrS family protein [Xanthomonadaceae bacterium]|nr:NnrS family protein [Xanthomonadaceae bacterium]
MPKIALLNLGFRPFFLGAAIFAIVSMMLWMGVYVLQLPLPITRISTFQWHAHEMIYGFAMAVVAGFLLTAVKNWTGVQTLYGFGLLALCALWALPRVLFLFGTPWMFVAGFFDMLFALCLIGSILYSIVRIKQWRQLGIIVILALLASANGCFYLGAAGLIEQGVFFGIYGGLFLIVGLILVIGRRVIPFFIEVGVGYPVKLFNSKWLDLVIIVFYIAFLVAEILVRNPWMVASTAMGLFVVNSARLVGWHTSGIWQKPLLWSLFIAFIWINLGFLLLAINVFLKLPNVVVLHAFSVGGIGVIILSMMARVTLGHTGRNVQNPPKAVVISLIVLITGAIFRVIVPLIAESQYVVWVAISQMLWIVAFLIFIITYFPMLVKPRIDGQFG